MKRFSGLLLIGLTYLSFVSLGLPDGLLGVAWPSLRVFFGLPLDALGPLLVMFTIGYLVSSFSCGRLLAHMRVGTLLALSCLATAISLLGYALASRWEMVLALGILAGLGAGAIDAGLNTYAATHFSPRMVNWLHACYGIGATLGPIIMTGVLTMGHPWQWGYGIVGLWQLGLAACFGLTYAWWPASQTTEPTSAPLTSYGQTLRRPVVWLGIAIFFLYTGLEAAAGAWVYSLFTEARGVAMMTAGTWVSIYWAGLTGGRLLSGLVVSFISVRQLLRFCILGLILGAVLIWSQLTTVLSFCGLALMGFSAAPIFPSLIATTPERLGEAHTANGIGLQIAAAVLGQSLLPSVIGILARLLGLEVVAPALLVIALLLLVLYEACMATVPRALPAPPAMAA